MRRRDFKVGDFAFHIKHRTQLFESCRVKIKKVLAEDYFVKIPGIDVGFIAKESELFTELRAAAKAREFFIKRC